MHKKPLQVLVVDDSAVVRQVLSAVLAQAGDMQVMAAADPFIAMEKMRRQRPDVIVLDLEMPRMDGLTFLSKIMSEDPIPVVVCSGRATTGTTTALRALEEGAVEIIAKPQLGLRDFIEESALIFVDAVRAAAQAKLAWRGVPMASARLTVAPIVTSHMIVAMGASTGGTEALRYLLTALPSETPGIVIVQHMPALFTAQFAARLNVDCRIAVKEAADGDRVQNGYALIAPGNRHMEIAREGRQYVIKLTDGPLVTRHRPSVDMLFRSVARIAGPNALGVIMTGMGDDGAAGLLAMRQAGAATIAQDEASSVVFGMPKEAIARGAAQEILPLTHIPTAILQKTLNR